MSYLGRWLEKLLQLGNFAVKSLWLALQTHFFVNEAETTSLAELGLAVLAALEDFLLTSLAEELLAVKTLLFVHPTGDLVAQLAETIQVGHDSLTLLLQNAHEIVQLFYLLLHVLLILQHLLPEAVLQAVFVLVLPLVAFPAVTHFFYFLAGLIVFLGLRQENLLLAPIACELHEQRTGLLFVQLNVLSEQVQVAFVADFWVGLADSLVNFFIDFQVAFLAVRAGRVAELTGGLVGEQSLWTEDHLASFLFVDTKHKKLTRFCLNQGILIFDERKRRL